MIRWHWIAAIVIGALVGLTFAMAAGELGESPFATDKLDVIMPTSVWWTFP